MMKALALYVHVPFCARKCDYCDFASWAGRELQWQIYFDALEAEIRRWSEITDFGLLSEQYSIKSLFIGGGTPTLVPATYIEEIIQRCRGIAEFEPGAEVTIEGNPGTVSIEKLAVYARAGINRISLGAQSFDDGLLKSLGRIHTAAQIEQAVDMAREAGFSNINLDLMYALPGQTMEQWMDTLDHAIALGVPHISAYSLIVEAGTPMAERVLNGMAVLPDDETVNAMQRAATKKLTKTGYGRYEISNYAKPKSECRHNLTYWRRGDYLGLGCAAHSLLGGCRFHNPETLDGYLPGGGIEDVQRLTRLDAMEETVMLSTRTTRGLDLERWRVEFGEDFMERRASSVGMLINAGLVEKTEGFLHCTERGLEVQNAVVQALLNERGNR